MSDVVHKITLSGSLNGVQLPRGAQVVTVATQHEEGALWYRFDADLMDANRIEGHPTDEANLEWRYFQAFPTGSTKVPVNAEYLGMLMFDNGYLIFHVFEVFPPFDTPL